jgi:Lrp/AsnC family transcriptional regulator for asnA, asnC and gidA
MIDRGRDAADWLEFAPRLSDLDRDLIRLLQTDGRRSFARMSQDLGVAQKTVRRRVHELREEGIIRITTVGDPYLMGYGVTALIGVTLDGSREASAVAGELATGRRAFYVIVASGRYNVLVEVSCKDDDDLLETVERDIAGVDGVSSYEIHPYIRLHYQNPTFESRREKATDAGDIRSEPISFDRIDREIIAHLSRDGRTPLQGIARELDVSESQVRLRVRRMVSSGALHIMALTSPRGVGFNSPALIGVKTHPGASIEQVATELAKLPAVIYVAICTGRYQIFTEVICAEREELFNFIDSDLRHVEGIAELEAWTYLRLFYRNVRPIEPESENNSVGTEFPATL